MKRIKAITDLIAYGDIADIGTGDGSISIHALETGKATRSIACDLNPGPLKISMQNAQTRSFDMGNSEIEFRLAFGLDKLKRDEAGTVIIAGMGGQTIVQIIDHARELLMADEGLCSQNEADKHRLINQLILQPQSDYRQVRKTVHSVGFSISNEIMIKERSKYYLIMDCRRGIDIAYSESDYLLGRFLPLDGGAVFYEYLKRELRIMENIMACMGDSLRQNTKRKEEILLDTGIMRECIATPLYRP